MEVNDSIELVKKIFADIESGKKKNEILSGNGLEQFDSIKYPEIKFTISKSEIEKLKEQSLITEENKIEKKTKEAE
ncbi:MAG: hypothetical protein IJR50_04660 [Treponema sp.]|nr:hypothetical protein [Treponema sp.]